MKNPIQLTLSFDAPAPAVKLPFESSKPGATLAKALDDIQAATTDDQRGKIIARAQIACGKIRRDYGSGVRSGMTTQAAYDQAMALTDATWKMILHYASDPDGAALCA